MSRVDAQSRSDAAAAAAASIRTLEKMTLVGSVWWMCVEAEGAACAGIVDQSSSARRGTTVVVGDCRLLIGGAGVGGRSWTVVKSNKSKVESRESEHRRWPVPPRRPTPTLDTSVFVR